MRSEIERIVGAGVVGLERVEGRGYTRAGRHRAFLDDGRTVFVKSAVDELSAAWLRVEIRVYTELRGNFMPVFNGWAEHDGLPLIVLEDLGDAHWPPPWREGDVEAVTRALREIAATAPPAGVGPLPLFGTTLWISSTRDPCADVSVRACTRERAASLSVREEGATGAVTAGAPVVEGEAGHGDERTMS